MDDFSWPSWSRTLKSSGGGVSFGQAVIPDLVRGIREWREGKWVSNKFEPIQSALGCVYLFGDMEIARELAQLGNVIIAVGKRSAGFTATRWLAANGPGSHTGILPGLEQVGAPGHSPWRGGDNLGGLESVRSVGWKEPGPLTHAKVLVLGHHQWIDTDYGIVEGWVGSHAWLGSANWTGKAREHAEIGLWVRDHDLVWELATWVASMVASSEPLSSSSALPMPDLEEAEIPEPDWDYYPFSEGEDEEDGEW